MHFAATSRSVGNGRLHVDSTAATCTTTAVFFFMQQAKYAPTLEHLRGDIFIVGLPSLPPDNNMCYRWQRGRFLLLLCGRKKKKQIRRLSRLKWGRELLLAALLIKKEEGLKSADVVRHAPTNSRGRFSQFHPPTGRSDVRHARSKHRKRTSGQSSNSLLSQVGC
jgi:hypothetical protein